jgi:uncharacterized protein (TIGR02271 family)
MEGRSDASTAIEDQYAGYTVYDPDGDMIGKVDDLFVGENDQPEYIGVKMGLLGTGSTLIPWEMVEVREADSSLIVSADDDHVKDGPTFDDREITPEFQNEVYSYYGLHRVSGNQERGSYAKEGVSREGSEDLDDRDEIRVQRSEEELAAGTREVEAGAIKVRKRVRTERESIEVPTCHEEVSVERVPLSGEASEAEIGEDEVRVQVTEEEVVVDKRAGVKEEVRIRKDVVEDTEVVEEDVRREEIDVEDDTSSRRSV